MPIQQLSFIILIMFGTYYQVYSLSRSVSIENKDIFAHFPMRNEENPVTKPIQVSKDHVKDGEDKIKSTVRDVIASRDNRRKREGDPHLYYTHQLGDNKDILDEKIDDNMHHVLVVPTGVDPNIWDMKVILSVQIIKYLESLPLKLRIKIWGSKKTFITQTDTISDKVLQSLRNFEDAELRTILKQENHPELLPKYPNVETYRRIFFEDNEDDNTEYLEFQKHLEKSHDFLNTYINGQGRISKYILIRTNIADFEEVNTVLNHVSLLHLVRDDLLSKLDDFDKKKVYIHKKTKDENDAIRKYWETLLTHKSKIETIIKSLEIYPTFIEIVRMTNGINAITARINFKKKRNYQQESEDKFDQIARQIILWMEEDPMQDSDVDQGGDQKAHYEGSGGEESSEDDEENILSPEALLEKIKKYVTMLRQGHYLAGEMHFPIHNVQLKHLRKDAKMNPVVNVTKETKEDTLKNIDKKKKPDKKSSLLEKGYVRYFNRHSQHSFAMRYDLKKLPNVDLYEEYAKQLNADGAMKAVEDYLSIIKDDTGYMSSPSANGILQKYKIDIDLVLDNIRLLWQFSEDINEDYNAFRRELAYLHRQDNIIEDHINSIRLIHFNIDDLLQKIERAYPLVDLFCTSETYSKLRFPIENADEGFGAHETFGLPLRNAMLGLLSWLNPDEDLNENDADIKTILTRTLKSNHSQSDRYHSQSDGLFARPHILLSDGTGTHRHAQVDGPK